MNYYVYLFSCWITHPFRWVMPGYRHEYFAIRLLFWNSYKSSYVTAQAMHETGNFTSPIFKENNNLFGIKKSREGKYQTGVNRGHATYKNVYQSIYDYYDLTKNRITAYGKALNDVPEETFKKGSAVAEQYNDYVTAKFYSLGYFTGDVVGYTNAVNNFSVRHKNNRLLYSLNWLLLCVLPASLYYLFSSVKAKQAKLLGFIKVKKGTAKR